MGNPLYKEKLETKKMSFLRQVIRRSQMNNYQSRQSNTSNHPLRALLEDPLDSLSADAETRSSLNSNTTINANVDDLESILLDNINPRIINMSVEPTEESPEEFRLSSLLDFEELFSNPASNNFALPNATRYGRSFNPSVSFHRWQSLRSTRPLSVRSSFVASRIPRPSIFNQPSERHSTSPNDQIPDLENNQT